MEVYKDIRRYMAVYGRCVSSAFEVRTAAVVGGGALWEVYASLCAHMHYVHTLHYIILQVHNSQTHYGCKRNCNVIK